MASNYKYFSEHDRVTAINNLKEDVLIVSGSDGWQTKCDNPKFFTQFASGTSLFATSVRVFDTTFGRSSHTTNNEYVNDRYTAEKNIYNQFSKILLGMDSGDFQKFEILDDLHNAYFINISREHFNDKIVPGSFNLTINVSGSVNIDLADDGVNFENCVTGRFGILHASSSDTAYDAAFQFADSGDSVGILFYEAGIAVLSPYIFSKYSGSVENPRLTNTGLDANMFGILTEDPPVIYESSGTIKDLIVSGSIEDHGEMLKERIISLQFQADTELNSTIYFCRAYNHEFNYSSNPTYLNNSKIIVKNDDPMTPPRAYITTVGLYSDDNQLLAVAKLSEPILKTPENELIARVRLDW